ncbi:hypothetical protein HOLleu_02720 [Holothuria leucospilota]|uniref:Uncharacterized protein n=1 Tax=Holothuria leucospilota TaxID=206669 RepID=A0A9Q1CSL5_HOLLE|nr:hypothetical protein HOLleu_02720 [Holothuria leucospilota]
MRLLTLLVFVVAVNSATIRAPLYRKQENIPGKYIVKLKDEFDVDKVVADLESSFLEYLGGKIESKYHTVKGFSAELSERALDLVRHSKAVSYVEEDSLVYAQQVASWGLDRIDSPRLPMDNVYDPMYDGTGVNIYIIDTGVSPYHDDVVGRCEVFYDAEPIQGNDGIDCHGHGSHCSGTAAGTMYGVAKNARIYGVRVLSCVGWGSDSDVIEGMDQVAAHAELPAVASMSLGGRFSQANNDAVQKMVDRGIVVAVAAGNSNEDACNSSPSSAEAAITVAASDSSDVRASFSNFGPCVDIYAPGVAITSIWIGSNTTSTTISGTSMACPHVAAVWPYVWEALKRLAEHTQFTPQDFTLVQRSLQRFSSFYKGERLKNSYVKMRLLIIFFLVVAANSATIKAPLRHMKDNIPGRYIVKLKDEFDVDTAIADLENSFLEYLGGKIDARYHTVKGFSAELSDRALDLVRHSKAVSYVEEDSLVYVQQVASWGLDRIDSSSLPMDDVYDPMYDGSGVNIYIIDTGVSPNHDDVIGRCAVFYEATTIRGNNGIDCHGHGSHCSGTAAGTMHGVAKNARIYGVRVINCFGWGSTSGIIEVDIGKEKSYLDFSFPCLPKKKGWENWHVRFHTTAMFSASVETGVLSTVGMDKVAADATLPAVASMSLGGGFSLLTNEAVDRMVEKGVVVAVSAGNSNTDACSQSPAAAERAITVAASDRYDTRASFSNYGPCVDIYAPGVAITSIWVGSDTATNTISGTSMSCPHVAGAAALVLDENPNYSPYEVTATLLNSAANDKISDVGAGTPKNKLLQVKRAGETV